VPVEPVVVAGIAAIVPRAVSDRHFHLDSPEAGDLDRVVPGNNEFAFERTINERSRHGGG